MKQRLGPDGIHLFDRDTGMNILVDEVAVPPERWTAAPRQVSIALTNVCDLACPYCYAPKSRDCLTAAQVKRWLVELDELGTFGVGFGGGEPTLHPHFAELCQFGSAETHLAMTCTTHGHHLTEGLVAQLQGHVHFMRLSMDGVDSTYERLRNRSFPRFLQKLRLASSAFPVGLNYVVNQATLPDLPQAAQLAERYGVRELLLLPEQGVKGRPGIENDVLTETQCWAETYSGSVALTVSANAATGFPVCFPLPLETPLAAFAHINARAELCRCSYSASGISLLTTPLPSALRNLNTPGGSP